MILKTGRYWRTRQCLQSVQIIVEPLLDLVTLLRPQAMLTAGILASGNWGVSFRKRDDVLFCWLEQGGCFLLRKDREPLLLQNGDFVLVRTSTPFALTSGPDMHPEDSEDLVARQGGGMLRVGHQTDAPEVVLRGGRFVFDAVNERLLTDLLPTIVHFAANDQSSWRLHTLLALNKAEAAEQDGSQRFVCTRLLEIVFVEVLRHAVKRMELEEIGLLAGLRDPLIARALSALHGNVARSWSVVELARICGVSRSTFASRFRAIVAIGPLAYLQRWRMVLARAQLRSGDLSIGELALSLGFQSSSAFSTAFTNAHGCSPKAFLISKRKSDNSNLI